MNFLTDPLLTLALHHFDNLDISQGDWFFSTFGPGNVINATDRPHERFTDYETLLILLQQRNKQKYDHIHKGTPFFFLSWLAFDLRNYEKALYYLDAAISEDIKNVKVKSDWITRPGAAFLKLSTGTHVAERIIKQIRGSLANQLERFNTISTLDPLTLEDFTNKFIANLIQNSSTRTIISSLYVFLLEHKERLIELSLKSTEGSSIGPIISHLFNGSLIFESLLKILYPNKDNGNPVKTLGEAFGTKTFQADFGERFQTSAISLQDILNGIEDNSLHTAFCTTAKVRNTTGHNLIWDNIFDSITNYEALMDQIVNALLFLIEKRFIR
jgi:hypothetical protein